MPSPVARTVRVAAIGWTTDPGMPLVVSMTSDSSPPHASSTFIAAGGSGRGTQGRGSPDFSVDIEIQQHAEKFDPGDPVDHAVVNLEHQGPASTFEALYEPGLPQRPVAIEWLRHDPSHQAAERSVVTGCGKCRVPQVVVEVEMWIVDPQWAAELEGHAAHTLAVPRDQVQLRGHEGPHIRKAWWRVIENAGASNVHVDLPVLKIKKLGIECTEPLHLPSPLPFGTPFRTLRPEISGAQGLLTGVTPRPRPRTVTFDPKPGIPDAVDSNYGSRLRKGTMSNRAELFMRDTDAFSWYLEKDPALRSTIVAVAWLDRQPDFDLLAARLERATRLAPRFRQRLLEPPGRLAAPRWVGADFDLSLHLHRIDSPPPHTSVTVTDFARDPSHEWL